MWKCSNKCASTRTKVRFHGVDHTHQLHGHVENSLHIDWYVRKEFRYKFCKYGRFESSTTICISWLFSPKTREEYLALNTHDERDVLPVNQNKTAVFNWFIPCRLHMLQPLILFTLFVRADTMSSRFGLGKATLCWLKRIKLPSGGSGKFWSHYFTGNCLLP